MARIAERSRQVTDRQNEVSGFCQQFMSVGRGAITVSSNKLYTCAAEHKSTQIIHSVRINRALPEKDH